MNESAKQYCESAKQYCESCSSKTLDECPICMENYEIGVVNKTRTDCGHTLCFKCFIILNYNSNKCPICRQQMQEQMQEPSVIHYHNHAPRHHTNCIRRIYNYFNSWLSHNSVIPIDHNTSQINRPHYPPPINRPHYPYYPHPNRRIVPL
jgi:hypothetical protein